MFSVWDYIQYRYAYYNYEGAEEIENTLYRAVTERNIRVIYFKPIKEHDNRFAYITDPEVYRDMFDSLDQRLAEHGISCAGKTARQLTKADYTQYDLLIGMDRANIRNMNRICGGDPDGKIRLLLDCTGRSGDVADPWYTGDFDAAWRDVLRGCQGLLRLCAPEVSL